MKPNFWKKTIALLLMGFFLQGTAHAAYKINPFTGKQDYYESGSTGAPTDATYVTQTSNSTLSAEQALGSLATGILKNTTTTGVLSIAAAGTDYLDPAAIGVTVQAYDTDLTTYAGITPSANIQSFLGSADYSTARSNLGVAIGTNVQAYDVTLTTTTAVQAGGIVYAADAGSNDTYVITLSPAPGSYTTGMVIHFKANTINTGAATINVNSLGAKTIKKMHDQDLADGDIEANQLVTLIYDGTNFEMQSQVATAASGAMTDAGAYVKPSTNGDTIRAYTSDGTSYGDISISGSGNMVLEASGAYIYFNDSAYVPGILFQGSSSATLINNGTRLNMTGGIIFNNDTTIESQLNIKCTVAGGGLYVKEGSNATMGTATLSGGTATVSTTKVTASSRIQLTTQSLGTVAVPMAIAVTGRSAGTSFTITSADVTDTSVVAWVIVEPA